MNFTCLQSELISAIQTVQKTTFKNPSPYQNYIYIEANEYNIKLVSSSSENTVIVTMAAQVSVQGKVLVPGNILRDIVSRMPSVNISISTDDNYVMTVKYTNMKYSIQCISSSGYDFLDDISSLDSFSMPTEAFKSCIAATYFAASTQETRPTLNGILLKCVAGSLDFVSTDGSRVAICTYNIGNASDFEIIIPARFIRDITSSQTDGDVASFDFNDRYVKLTMGNITVISGLITGKFINYRSIIPTQSGTLMTCNRNEFLNILERAYLLSDEDLYTVKFDIRYSKLVVSSNSINGEAFEEIFVNTDGNPITIAFNSRSFIEILKNIEQENIVFEFTTGTRICMIRPLDRGDLIYLISPIRI